MTRTETRYGCFLSDLTGLARSPSTANLPGASYQTYRGRGQGGDSIVRHCERSEAIQGC